MAKRNTHNIDKIVVHHSATKENHDVRAADIDQWHRDRGFDSIGYHFVICRDGTLEAGRPIDIVGAHCRGHNRFSIGICMIGGISEEGEPENNFNYEQFQALSELLKVLKVMFPKTLGNVKMHRELANTQCPAFDLESEESWYWS